MTYPTDHCCPPNNAPDWRRCPTRRWQPVGDGHGRAPRSAHPVHPHGPSVINTAGEEQTEFTLAQIDALAQSWSVWYHNQGVGPRDRVALYIADTFAYTIHLNALAQLGAIGVLINSKASPALALGLCQRTTPVGIYTDRSRFAAIGEGIESLDGLRWTSWPRTCPHPPAALPDAWRFRHAPEDPVSIMHSSGTTGRPKAVIQNPCVERRWTALPPRELHRTHQRTTHDRPTAVASRVHRVHRLLHPRWHAARGALRPERRGTGGSPAPAPAEGGHVIRPRLRRVGRARHGGRHRRFGRLLGHHGRRHPRGPHPGDPGQAQPELPPATFYDRFGTTELGWGLVVQPRTLSSERTDRRVGKADAVAEVAVLRRGR